MSDKKARHFHAGKLRKKVGGVEYVEVAESNGKVFVGRNGLVITPRKRTPYRGTVDTLGYRWVKVAGIDTVVHRVILEVFRGPAPDGYETDHINTNRGDNRLSNLKWVTKIENAANPKTRVRKLRVVAKMVSRHSVKVVGYSIKDGTRVGPFESQAAAARAIGLSKAGNFSSVLRGRRNCAGGYRWEMYHG